MQDHPDRDAIEAELHARPVVAVPLPSRVRRVIGVGRTPDDVRDVFGALRHWCVKMGAQLPDEHARQHTLSIGNKTVTWERHNEFVTLTWTGPLSDRDANPTDIGLELLDLVQIVGAIRIDVINQTTLNRPQMVDFDVPSLCHVRIEEGAGEVATDFVEDKDGFTRFEFAAAEVASLRRAILTRRMLEIETYARMALLGLPTVRREQAELHRLEGELAQLIRSLPERQTAEQASETMIDLHTLSIETAALGERVAYRIAASAAYSGILNKRLQSLGESPVALGAAISTFLTNRVRPAVRTMEATEKRINAISDKIGKAVSMLNARNGLELEVQNSQILKTISETAHSQFRLQETVEGLSSIAITYYLLGIVGYVLGGPLKELHWSKEWTLSILAPIVFALVFWASRQFWRRHDR